MIKFSNDTKKTLIELSKTKNLNLEGNILKILDSEDDEEFKEYIKFSIDKDKETRRRRLDITKQIQKQNNELLIWKSENERIYLELQEEIKRTQEAKLEAEKAKEIVENDLDILQKKSQFQLMSKIIKISLWIIASIGILTTGMYVLAIVTNTETQIIGSTWSNLLGILLTNSFSIVGTIMGVKYASGDRENQ
jgi:hypothetical protein